MSESSKRLTKEELEDLEIEFSMKHGVEADRLELLLNEIYNQFPETYEEKLKRCNSFIETYNQLKDFCKEHGRGGVRYFNQQIKGDPHYESIKNELKFLKKYPNGVDLEDAILEIYKYLKKHNAIIANHLYKSFDDLDYPIIPTIKLMIKIGSVCVDDSEHPKVYYLPTEQGKAALDAIRGKEQAFQKDMKVLGSKPNEEIAIAAEQFTTQIDDMVSQIDEEITNRKKKGFFANLFGK